MQCSWHLDSLAPTARTRLPPCRSHLGRAAISRDGVAATRALVPGEDYRDVGAALVMGSLVTKTGFWCRYAFPPNTSSLGFLVAQPQRLQNRPKKPLIPPCSSATPNRTRCALSVGVYATV